MSGFNDGSNSLFLSEFVSNNDLKFIQLSNKGRVTTIHHEVLQESQVLYDEDQRKCIIFFCLWHRLFFTLCSL